MTGSRRCSKLMMLSGLVCDNVVRCPTLYLCKIKNSIFILFPFFSEQNEAKQYFAEPSV